MWNIYMSTFIMQNREKNKPVSMMSENIWSESNDC